MNDDSLYEYLQICIIQYFKSIKTSTEDIYNSLDNLGFRVGHNLVERMAPDQTRFTDDISIMKYICKEYWTCLFSKQIDNLRTNNSGIFVLQDNNFKLLAQLSSEDQSNEMSQYYLAFTCGLLRGTLSNFGYSNQVTADIQSPPCCKFQINLVQNLVSSTVPNHPTLNTTSTTTTTVKQQQAQKA